MERNVFLGSDEWPNCAQVRHQLLEQPARLLLVAAAQHEARVDTHNGVPCVCVAGVNRARGMSLDTRFTQNTQLYMQ